MSKIIADEVIDSDRITDIAEYNPIAAGLIELRQTVATADWNYETTKGDRDARQFRAACVSLRTRLVKAAKDAKLPHQEAVRKLNDDLKRLTEMIEEIENPVDEKIKAIEDRKAAEKEAKRVAEEQRIAGIMEAIRKLSQSVDAMDGRPAYEIAEAFELAAALTIGDEFAEFSTQAEAAKAAAMVRLSQMHTKAVAEAERAAAIAAEREALRIEREKAAAEQAAIDAANAERERIIREEREAIERQRAELERQAQAIEDAKREQERREREAAEQAERAERERIAKEEAAALSAAAMPTDTPRITDQEQYAEVIRAVEDAFDISYQDAANLIVATAKWIEELHF